jgi:hypothetical protein
MDAVVNAPILQPVVLLAAWTMFMCAWLYATRIPAMRRLKVDPDSLARDPEASLDKLLPPPMQWKAHNYNHLHEAPTVFYACVWFWPWWDKAAGSTPGWPGLTSAYAWFIRWCRPR